MPDTFESLVLLTSACAAFVSAVSTLFALRKASAVDNKLKSKKGKTEPGPDEERFIEDQGDPKETVR